MIHQPHGRRARSGHGHRDPGPRDPPHEGRLTDILVDATGKSKDSIHKDIDRDFYLCAAQAKEYGLIDDVLPPRKKGEGSDKRDK